MILPKLNMDGRPIADKYCEGKMKRTLKRESKESEIAKGEAMRRDSEGGQIMVKLVGSVDRNAGSVSFP